LQAIKKGFEMAKKAIQKAAAETSGVGTKEQTNLLQTLEANWTALVSAHKNVSHRTHAEAEFDARRNPKNENVLMRLVTLKNVIKWHKRLLVISTYRPYAGEESFQQTRIREERDHVKRECAAAQKARGMTADDKQFLQTLVSRNERGDSAGRLLEFVLTTLGE
jgi:hypothetical protein